MGLWFENREAHMYKATQVGSFKGMGRPLPASVFGWAYYHQHTLLQVSIRPEELPHFGMPQAGIQTEHSDRINRTPMPLFRAHL